jgi:hypothetical protein
MGKRTIEGKSMIAPVTSISKIEKLNKHYNTKSQVLTFNFEEMGFFKP